MSMLNRLVRSFETLSNVALDGKDRGGIRGEEEAQFIIDDDQNGCSIRNPIIPHPRRRGFYLETDFLVYTYGTLYCVEIKNYRGKVAYPAIYRTVYSKKGWFIFSRTVETQVFDHYNYTKMTQTKMGYNGQGPITLTIANPLIKTQHYIEDLKYYLNRIDQRFATIPIYPVVGFAPKTDISAIYNPDAGIIHINELPGFFARYGNRQVGQHPPAWILPALRRLPTWDRVLTNEHEWINGTFVERELSFKDMRGRRQVIPFAKIAAVDLHREGSFSAHDTLAITYTDGTRQTYESVGGDIRLNRFKGEVQTHKLRNITRVVVGIANKF